MRMIYNTGVWFYYLMIRIAAVWNPKAKKWLKGRKRWRENLKSVFSYEDEVIWVHCASLGEFEQGRPLIEKIRGQYPHYKILLTFFSPSGYEKRKDYPEADLVTYLPLDTRRNARDFLSMVPVRAVFFVKYEFWYNFIEQAYIKNVPVYLASGTFTRSQVFFRWYGKWYRRIFQKFTRVFVQDDASKTLLRTYAINNVTVSGDTRFDRVAAIASRKTRIDEILDFAGNKPVLIAGSTWERDDEVIRFIFQHLEMECKLIIAPHEPVPATVRKLQEWFPDHFLFSKAGELSTADKKVCIVDTIGHLSSLYQYATIAYVGGGFGKGIHNVLEPAAAGLPVLFGPNYHRFVEAHELLAKGSAFVVRNNEDGFKTFDKLLRNDELLASCSEVSRKYTSENTGASDTILKHVFSNSIS